MKVYIIYIFDYNDSYIEAVYTNQKEAEKHINNNNYNGDASIFEFDVNDKYETD